MGHGDFVRGIFLWTALAPAAANGGASERSGVRGGGGDCRVYVVALPKQIVAVTAETLLAAELHGMSRTSDVKKSGNRGLRG